MARRRSRPGRGAVRFLLLSLALLSLAAGLVVGLVLARTSGFPRAERPPAADAPSPPSAAPSRPGGAAPGAGKESPLPPGAPRSPAPGSRRDAPPLKPPSVGLPAPGAPPRTLRPAVGRVAIIFDDAGGSLDDIEAIVALERPVTIAVLPGLRFSREVAERVRAAGLEVFLHLPLEADNASKALGPGGITTAMSEAEITAAVRAGLASVPGAVGVNNHMGSKGTADERVMRVVLREVKARGLIWVDSRTTTATVGARLAAEMGIPTASRHVFLDNEDDPAAIRAEILRLIQVAREKGEAIGIGHAHRLTAQVLREMLGEFERWGIQFVPASALVR